MSGFGDIHVDIDTKHIRRTVDHAMKGVNRQMREMKREFKDFRAFDADHIQRSIDQAMKGLDRAMRDIPFGAECDFGPWGHGRHERHEHRHEHAESRHDEPRYETDDRTQSVLKALERGEISVDDAMEQLGER